MARTSKRETDPPASGQRSRGRPGGARKLRGLRIARTDEPLVEAVRPYITGADNESELAYEIWRPGLDVVLARLLSMGMPLPRGYSEDAIATRVALQLASCIPLLRRTGKLELLGISAGGEPALALAPQAPPPVAEEPGEIDPDAASFMAGMGDDDFI